MARRPFVAGNWKMYGSSASITTLIKELIAELNASNVAFDLADVAVFPSFVYLPLVKLLTEKSFIQFGAQNLNDHLEGAYTGEVSAAMLSDIGCNYVIVGHSERRQYYGETDATVTLKVKEALAHKITPILCIGETKAERESGLTDKIVLTQLNAVLDGIGIELANRIVIAYEPVWAIGTGLTATPEQAEAVHALIRQTLELRSQECAKNTRILYGGSVKADNAKAIFSMPNVDGGLVGGASLKAKDFVSIIRSVSLKS